MQDPLDAAADYQARLNEEAMARHSGRPRQQQRVIDGQVVCLDCDDPVSEERLAVMPDAALCVICATAREK